MNRLKKMMLSVLGEKRYLSFLAGSYQRLYRTGILGQDYQDVYFLKQSLEPGFYCADIGAHLGYYTLEMSRLVKDTGRIIAVEPMSQFNRALKRLLQKEGRQNVDLHQLAMGGEGEYVEMGIPEVAGSKKFAYARIKESNISLQYIESERVRNEKGDQLFKNLPRLDFIKCDVEGLEVAVFASMKESLARFLPFLLCELADKNERLKLWEMLAPLGYAMYFLDKGKLQQLEPRQEVSPISHNYYFLPPLHQHRLGKFIRS